ncbi:SAC3/GANP/Nin1/mts3/eIF-3 p25, partial [Obelidium mucronatum]
GECLDMCPEYERHERWFRDALFPFEKIPGTNDVDHTKAVKRYRRSASDNFTVLPCDVRPPHVLVKTLDYLFRDLLPQYPLLETHGFIRDRTRGIRNDFTIQNYRGMEAIECHERIARYHIMCTSQLVQSESFSVQQEQEQMRKTLQSLREYYADMKTAGIHCPNEPEFQAYYILSHIWQNETFTLAESLAPHIYNHPHVQLALRLQYLAQSATGSQERGFSHTRGGVNAYTEFFRTLQDSATPYLFAAILHMDFDVIRCNALMSM